MSPTGYRHGQVELRIAASLDAFVRPRRLGRVLVGEVGVYTRRDPDRVRGLDVAYVAEATYARRTPGLAYLDVAPELVAEVLSPDDRAAEVTQKLREYFEIGVQLVWLADPEARSVFAYRSLTDVREFGGSDRLTGDQVLPGYESTADSFFTD